jgi:glycosyltransferase involved in cell wall biosynthesis
VESVLAQSFHDFELILVDDASTDDSLAIARGLTDTRIRILVQETNAGASAARNAGIAAAQAEWVAFQDSDDLWFPDKLARQMARLTAAGADHVAAYCGMLIEDLSHSGKPARYLPDPAIVPREGDILDSLLERSFISTQTLIVRRDLALQLGGFDPEMPALVDWEFMIRLAQLGTVALVDAPLVQQRFSDNSLTRSAERRLRARQRILQKHHALLAVRPRTLALHHNAIAGALRRSAVPDRLKLAQSHLAQAIALAPGVVRYRVAAALVWMQQRAGR